MKVIFTNHLRIRLKQRGISLKLSEEVFRTATEYYWDNLRNHHIKVAEIHYKDKLRKVLLAYDKITEDTVEFITLHPITNRQIQQRLDSGRWKYEKTSN